MQVKNVLLGLFVYTSSINIKCDISSLRLTTMFMLHNDSSPRRLTRKNLWDSRLNVLGLEIFQIYAYRYAWAYMTHALRIQNVTSRQ